MVVFEYHTRRAGVRVGEIDGLASPTIDQDDEDAVGLRGGNRLRFSSAYNILSLR